MGWVSQEGCRVWWLQQGAVLRARTLGFYSEPGCVLFPSLCFSFPWGQLWGASVTVSLRWCHLHAEPLLTLPPQEDSEDSESDGEEETSQSTPPSRPTTHFPRYKSGPASSVVLTGWAVLPSA